MDIKNSNTMLFKTMSGLGDAYDDYVNEFVKSSDGGAAAPAVTQPSTWDKIWGVFTKATDTATKIAPYAADVAEQVAILKAQQNQGPTNTDIVNLNNGAGAAKSPMSTTTKVL